LGAEQLIHATDQRYAVLSVSAIYETVRRNRGYLWAVSELGRGNTFRIFLPPAATPPIEPEAAPYAGALQKGSGTILLVEPVEMVRELTARVLDSCGYTVRRASSGSQALELLRQADEPPQLLLTEVVMPDMDGHELANQIAALQPQARALFMSGYSDETVESHGVSWHDSNFIRKPFTLEQLSRRIREILEG
jgi:two-component system, cell cycle sensor histidine kinase and response regulator CckA